MVAAVGLAVPLPNLVPQKMSAMCGLPIMGPPLSLVVTVFEV